VYQHLTPDLPDHLMFQLSTNRQKRYHRVRYQNADGTVRILDIHTIALTNQGQEQEQDQKQIVDQCIVHAVDVTETVQLQARVIENERFAASGRLAASVAHELNTPLQAIQTSLGLVRQIIIEEDRNRFLANTEEEIIRVGHIVRQMLDLYRPSAATNGPVDIALLVDRILLLIGSRIREQGVLVKRALAVYLPPVWGRGDELLQVLLNLIINALEAMPNGGTLCLAAQTQYKGSIVIDISDTGCGISSELRERIFEPFVTTKPDGTGLGLAISRQIVQQHGGTIKVVSERNVGSTFTIVLPNRRLNSTEPDI
jgi:signal transduction histidine kinase